jgi:Tfp pilus assembly protein PilX
MRGETGQPGSADISITEVGDRIKFATPTYSGETWTAAAIQAAVENEVKRQLTSKCEPGKDKVICFERGMLKVGGTYYTKTAGDSGDSKKMASSQ